MFAGLSSLRAREKAARAAGPPSEQARQLQAYLQKYTGGAPAADRPGRPGPALAHRRNNGKGTTKQRWRWCEEVVWCAEGKPEQERKRRKKKRPPAPGNIHIVDHAASGFKEAAYEEDEEEDGGRFFCTCQLLQTSGVLSRFRECSLTACLPCAEAPVVANVEEAERLARMAEKVPQGAVIGELHSLSARARAGV